MTEDKDVFTKEETIVLGDLPYFPSEKVAKLMGINQDYMDGILNATEIAKHSIEVEFRTKGIFETYIDPEGCLLLAMRADVKRVGKELKISIATISKFSMLGQEEKIHEYCKSPKAHRFVKAIFNWAEAEKIEGFWAKMPVQ